MQIALEHQLAAILGYFLGSIPFGLVLTRLAGLGDVRKIGSGNIGATNVLRTGNKKLAIATLLLDGGKGAVAVLLAAPYGQDFALIAALCAVIGHNFPIWLKFEGGKGVATTLGVLLALSWQVGLLACLIWVGMAAVFRYSSLAALTAFAASPVFAWFLVGERAATVVGLLAALGIARHHANIRRLMKGEEPKIGGKQKSAAEPAPPEDTGDKPTP
ncbi:MAG: glycerol-3-phosphate 1-O-acyltransferase PlsY [Rhodospirillales bacterium]|nr:glycerol-3-phosphate 1-O-acyltransferase PlsY [Rhodospirillales bacterium]